MDTTPANPLSRPTSLPWETTGFGPVYAEHSRAIFYLALRFLGDQGYDPVYGARPLKRAIMRFVQDPLAGLLLKGEFGPGETILVDRSAGADELTFKKNRRPTVAAVS